MFTIVEIDNPQKYTCTKYGILNRFGVCVWTENTREEAEIAIVRKFETGEFAKPISDERLILAFTAFAAGVEEDYQIGWKKD